METFPETMFTTEANEQKLMTTEGNEYIEHYHEDHDKIHLEEVCEESYP
jgi:hypothetical protein